MILLDTTTDTIEMVLGAAVAANQPQYYVSYIDTTSTTYVPAETHGLLNSTTPVTAVSAPANNTTPRQIKFISVFNADTTAVTLTIRLDDTSTEKTLWSGVLGSNEMVQYADSEGWCTFSSAGVRKITDPSVPGVSRISYNGGTVYDGQLSFADVAGWSFGMNGQTLTAAEGNTVSYIFPRDRYMSIVAFGSNSTNANITFFPLWIQQYAQVTAGALMRYLSVQGSTNATNTSWFNIYSQTGLTLSLASTGSCTETFASGSAAGAVNDYGAYSGSRVGSFSLNNTWNLTPGCYLVQFIYSGGPAAGTEALSLFWNSTWGEGYRPYNVGTAWNATMPVIMPVVHSANFGSAPAQTYPMQQMSGNAHKIPIITFFGA